MLGLTRNFPISSGSNRLSVYPGLPIEIDLFRLIGEVFTLEAVCKCCALVEQEQICLYQSAYLVHEERTICRPVVVCI